MKALLLGLLLWQTAVAAEAPRPDPHAFRYQRSVTMAPPGGAGNACATLDGTVYEHAAASLKDLRLYRGSQQVPYAITLSESEEFDSEPARVVNLGMQGRHIVFDLEMPDRAYTDVLLDLDAHDFIASAEVAGRNAPTDPLTRLGTFTVFDLAGQHLSRMTTLHLQETRFHTLHVELNVSSVPPGAPVAETAAMIRGASVPPSREAQTVYTPVAVATTVQQRGRQTVASFRLPAHVPVERVSFVVAPGFTGNFSRTVQVTGHAVGSRDSAMETLFGSVMRVQLTEAGRELRQQQMSVPATLGANLQTDAVVEVLINNGDDQPLPIAAVRLEMRQRRLCFEAAGAETLTLMYGDPVLEAPMYDFARMISLSGVIAVARLGPQERNPSYHPRPAPLRPLTERHPELLWIVLLAVVCVLAVVATHSAKKIPR